MGVNETMRVEMIVQQKKTVTHKIGRKRKGNKEMVTKLSGIKRLILKEKEKEKKALKRKIQKTITHWVLHKEDS